MDIISAAAQMLCGLYYLVLNVSGAGSFPRRLTAQEEAAYVEKLMQGDRNARQMLIEHNLRLVAHVTRKYMGTAGERAASDCDDLVSIGTIGLIKAVDTFKPEKGTRFSSYAARCIENECLMHFRSSKKNAKDVYISEPIDTDSHGNELTLSDIIAQDDTIADDLDLKLKSEMLREKIGEVLDERELDTIVKRYGLDGNDPLTQKEVAEKLGISRSYVSRIEKKAIEKLKKIFGE